MIEQRSKHYGSPSAKFAILLLMTLDTPAWRALSTAAQALYPWLVMEFKGKNYNNNGKIRLSVRQAALTVSYTHLTLPTT